MAVTKALTTKENSMWDELRKPFPKEAVGKLPRGGIQLDYVGHAAVTDRLLAVDPEWTWEPLATDENGLPLLDGHRNLWIKLTIGGVTRIGVGDGKSAKECIGDAIRNGAMRFGVALDLWSKEELESHVDQPQLKNDKQPIDPEPPEELPTRQIAKVTNPVDRELIDKARNLMKEKGHTGEKAKAFLDLVLGKSAPVTVDDYNNIIAALDDSQEPF